MQHFHKSGFVYNGLKLDNIIIKDINCYKSTIYDKLNLQIQDFNYITRYRDDQNNHVENLVREELRSNLLNASLEVMKF